MLRKKQRKVNHMKNRCINELERFDIRDHHWSLVSRTERDLRVHILEPSGSWEFQGEPFTEAFITFRGFRLNWAKRLVDDGEVPLPFAEAMDHLSAEPLFVFSYGFDDVSCEICGLGSDIALAMDFSFEEVLIEWDYAPKEYVGELIKK